MERISILGVGFDNITKSQALDKLADCINTGKSMYVVTPNPEFVYTCYHDASLYPLLENAGLCVPDGIGVIYAAKIQGTPLKERVAGIELGEELLKWASENSKTVFFLGSKPGIAEKAAENLKKKYPKLEVAGMHDGYFKDDGPVVDEIARSKADIVFCCMGFPRQERFMSGNIEKCGAKVMLGLGGSLDVFAGEVKRAPEFFCRAGLEWFYRLMKEPSRIGRMMKLPAFLWIVIWKKMTGSRKKVK